MPCEYLVPYPKEIEFKEAVFSRPESVMIQSCEKAAQTADMCKEDLQTLTGISIQDKAAFVICFEETEDVQGVEHYVLDMTETEARVKASEESGFFYGMQTLLQILVLEEENIPCVHIDDSPAYQTRSFMIDMGRAVFTIPLIKRVIRMLARLKMNTLHMHLNDDQLCGVRFEHLPLGTENPGAISIEELGEIVQYARKYHVSILPEFECWGHAQSVIYHYPEIHGGPGMWGGMSFGIGEETYELFEKVFDELVPVLEDVCAVHVGLDEAQWNLLPSVSEADKEKYTPTTLVDRIYDILQEAGKKHGKEITVHLWADHKGRPLSDRVKDKVVIEPWKYRQDEEVDIKQKCEKYGKEKGFFMMGGGMSSGHFGGHFGATRIWCQEGRKYPNAQGVTVCMWEGNDLAERLIGLYGGADYAWSPDTPAHIDKDTFGERLWMQTALKMRKWQTAFKDGDHEAIQAERGPEIYRGYYCWGEQAGQPAAPTVEFTL